MGSTFSKNIFVPNERVDGIISINNNECQLAVKTVRFFVEQVLHLRIGHHSHTVRRKLVEQTCPGPNEGQGGWTTNMHVDLDKIRYEVKDTKKKKGVEKKISPED